VALVSAHRTPAVGRMSDQENTTMNRAAADAFSALEPAATSEREGAPAASRRQIPTWLMAFGFWTLIVLVYSTRQQLRIGSYEWVRISWVEGLKASAAQWYSWGLLSVAIYWVNRRLPFAPHALLPRLLAHVPLSLLFTVAYSYVDYGATQLIGAASDRDWVGPTLLETMSRVVYRFGTFVYWAIVMIFIAMDYQNDLRKREVRAATLERLLADARLEALRTQLDPHFLFNTLNSISAYVERAPRKARLMIEQLGDMLRLSLEHATEQEIPLERELTFVDRYVQLQLVRFADRMDVRVQIDPEATAAAVPTLLLQPLVENAIRHGVSQIAAPGAIEISAWRSDERLHLRVRDSGPGLPAGWTLESSAGIGLKNTRARLEHLYGPGHYGLEIASDGEQGTRVDVSIPYRTV
jgi:signal transduction histidine kinase